MNTRKLTTMAIMAALSVVLVALIHFPIFPAVAFLEYDPADIPILITGFAFGPMAGLAVTLVAAVVQGVTVSAASGVYGVLMHVLATGAYVITAGLVYKRKKTKQQAAIATAAGVLAMAAVMFGANLIVTPFFMMGAVNADTVGAVMALMPYILAFNLIKAGANGLITFFVYKKVSPLMKREKSDLQIAA